jgi:hypothetical protein
VVHLTTRPLVKPRRTPVRASLHHLAEGFVDGILDALRIASFLELETLEGPAASRSANGSIACDAATFGIRSRGS